MPKMIIAIEGEVVGQFALAKDRTTLGRRAYNDIVIDNPAVSGEHALLHMKRGGEVEIEDLDSTNGTYVNGHLVRKQVLRENDVIDIGGCRVRFRARHNPAGGAGGRCLRCERSFRSCPWRWRQSNRPVPSWPTRWP